MPDFGGPVSEVTLRAILARSVTAQNVINSDSLKDDLRMLDELDVHFVGRAAYVWELPPDDEEHFRHAAAFADAAHARRPTMVLQAAVFEAVYRGMDRIPIPGWVFEALGEPVEDRCFRWDDCFGPDFATAFRWTAFGDDCQVPDITRPETRRWFYYRCCRYIDAGYEAIHLGQVHLTGSRDAGYARFAELIDRIRAYAALHARRHWVLLDAHTHGISRAGRLLFDLHSRPLSCLPDRQHPEELILQVKGRSLGGITPSGWTCTALPYLVEIDNWGGTHLSSRQWDQVDRATVDRWGRDDIAWFAHQPTCARDRWLTYNHRMLRSRDPDAYFQMPASRILGRAPVHCCIDGVERTLHYYNANRPSPACPHGFDQEDTIAAIWAESPPTWSTELAGLLRRPAPTTTLATGEDSPEDVHLVGDLLHPLGGQPGNSWDPHARLLHRGAGRYWRAVVLSRAGSWTCAIAIGGTMTQVIRSGGLAGGPAWRLTTTEPNTELLLEFDYPTRSLRAVDRRGDPFPGLAPDEQRRPAADAGGMTHQGSTPGT